MFNNSFETLTLNNKFEFYWSKGGTQNSTHLIEKHRMRKHKTNELDM